RERGRRSTKTVDVKLLSCPLLALTGAAHPWVGRSRQTSKKKWDVSKTIYADGFSLWLRGEDAGSPGDHPHSL
ncbi:hypothetical protein BD414DRAFT_570692, partial [Trametes punicea]